ncbi:hypothetical protein OIU34_31825 [Pararhizobium sp. BT-229]|uniref:hypothetical protein n=1 Tax=Pararhizobium sp. BT-229 TaxID=2986923 RepID=UPI0021F761B6|nr:hypothetical protein [Pararhizobium sp. BT-229]MCV9966465.1 hypothetical protein [Pararhizobium sp. BT-229]
MVRNMIRNLVGTAAIALAVTAQPAAAQQVFNCAEHSQVVESLGSHYSETLQAVGLINQTAILEVFVSESGTWTMLVTNLEGHSCVVFAGESWEALAIVPGLKTKLPAFGQTR